MDIPQGGSSCPLSLVQNGIWNIAFNCGGNPKELEKNPSGEDGSLQQTRPTCDTVSGIQIRTTAVGGERSHPGTILDPLNYGFEQF